MKKTPHSKPRLKWLVMEKTMLVSGVTLRDWKELLLHAGNELKKKRKGEKGMRRYRADLKLLILKINLAIGTSLVEKRFCDTLIDVHHHDGVLTIRGVPCRVFRNLLTNASLGIMAATPNIWLPEWVEGGYDPKEYNRLENLRLLVKYLERLMSARIKDTYPRGGTPCLKDRIRHRVLKLKEENRETAIIERILADALASQDAKYSASKSVVTDSGDNAAQDTA